ncbi:transient receptor potential cation channel subfamily M member 3-like [Saccostrea echinata]|uniref:transient receptor potential cation channel subfamily M member 3-like n=1 Tax=Saccostrea echinata TaxID=191078 RepID=UPI002A8409E0|nr:transient receptor potential cation channel subfamily M member 3-like [Saccostrea echinata]
MNYIQEKDELERLKSPTGWINNIKHFFIKEDEVSNKAGRLLLNHGYLDVAYKTKNECFLENPKLKTMIKELWYGEEYQTRRKIDTILRLFLCIMHVFIMPFMLFTLDKPSWIYKKYHTPILKLWVNTVGLLSFLAAFAYMLLFDYKENGVSQSEFAVLFWIVNKFVDEFQQICIAVYRDSKRKREKSFLTEYGQDMWNRLDLLIILTSFLGFIVKLLFEDDFLQGFAKIMFLVSYIMLNIRVLNMFWTSEFLGSQLVIIQKKIKITSAFMAIMIVIMMCYNVVDYALLYPNTEFTWTEIENIVRNGYWTLYGDFQEDAGNDCTDNATLYSQGVQQRCPSYLGALLSPYLRAIYCLIAILMLLNMLIAIYTCRESNVSHKIVSIHSRERESNVFEDYSIEQKIMSEQNMTEEKDADKMYSKSPGEEVDKKISKIIQELNEVKVCKIVIY